MQIGYVVPAAISKGPMGAAEAHRRELLLQSWAFPGTQVTVIEVDRGVTSIESAYEELIAAPGCIDSICGLEREGIDATIIGCFADPGLDAARELVTIPVIGPGEASLLLAAHLGHRFSVLSVFEGLASMHRTQAFRAGVLDKLASVVSLETQVLQLMIDPEATFGRTVEAGRTAMERDGAEALVLGCMTLSFLNTAPQLSAVLGIPVINAGRAALKAAEGMISIGLSHSKKAYPAPPRLRAALDRRSQVGKCSLAAEPVK